MESKQILDAIKKVRETTQQKKFRQSFDLAVNLKELNLKKPESKIKEEIMLPHGRGKPIEIGAIAEGELAENAKKAGIKIIIGKDDLHELAKNKPKAKKVVRSVDAFIAQPDLMIEVGKTLGPILGPRDKMPKPTPPKTDLKPVIERLNKIVSLKIKEQQILHCIVGNESMADTQIQENIESVLNFLKRKLPKGEVNIRNAYLKLTMGPSVKIETERVEKK